MKKKAPLLAHVRDILLLPVTVTVVVPYYIRQSQDAFLEIPFYAKVAGSLIGLAGVVLFISTVYLFATEGKGTLAPWSTKHKLVIRGPYRYCRNPMITGVLFILVSEALLLSSTGILEWAGIFFLINNIYFFLSEEPELLRFFGDEYAKYKKSVPRWLPRITPYRPEGN